MLILAALAIGCTSAVMMETRGESEYAPVNERSGGQVKYLASGLESLVRARREDAYHQMYERCGGKYRIVAEWEGSGGTVSSAQAHAVGSSAYGSGYSVTMVVRTLDFECVDGDSRMTKVGPRMNDDVEVADENADYVEPPSYGGASNVMSR